jgi:hypothetical protein
MDMQTGLPIETPFMRQMYDAMVLLVAADDLIQGLTIVYGDDLATAGKPTEDDGLRVARQFMAFHEIVKRQQAEQSKTASAPSSSGASAIAVSGAEDNLGGGQDRARNEVVGNYELEMELDSDGAGDKPVRSSPQKRAPRRRLPKSG